MKIFPPKYITQRELLPKKLKTIVSKINNNIKFRKPIT